MTFQQPIRVTEQDWVANDGEFAGLGLARARDEEAMAARLGMQSYLVAINDRACLLSMDAWARHSRWTDTDGTVHWVISWKDGGDDTVVPAIEALGGNVTVYRIIWEDNDFPPPATQSVPLLSMARA